MTKKLLVVFASGIILATALLSIAWLVGGRNFVGDLQKHDGWAISFDDDDNPSSARVTKTLAFDSTKPLTVDATVNLKFVRGNQASMTVEGTPSAIAALRWEGGRLSLDRSQHIDRHALKVTVVAPQLPGVVLNGAASVELADLQQPAFMVKLNGAGSIEGSGKVQRVDVASSGAGNIDLAALDTEDARIRADGVGHVEINASGKVDVAISGAGNVSLHRKPRELTSSISGFGSIDHDY